MYILEHWTSLYFVIGYTQLVVAAKTCHCEVLGAWLVPSALAAVVNGSSQLSQNWVAEKTNSRIGPRKWKNHEQFQHLKWKPWKQSQANEFAATKIGDTCAFHGQPLCWGCACYSWRDSYGAWEEMVCGGRRWQGRHFGTTRASAELARGWQALRTRSNGSPGTTVNISLQ